MVWLKSQIILSNWIMINLTRETQKIVHLVFLKLQNFNDNLHFKELTTWSFCSCKGYLWNSLTIGMAYDCVVCVCGWGGGLVGVGNLGSIKYGFLKT
jgi:hypothetical protein